MDSKHNILAEVADNKSKKLLEKESRILTRNKIKEESDNKLREIVEMAEKTDHKKTLSSLFVLGQFLEKDL